MMETIKMISGILTPMIAIIVAYIACQQYKTNKLKLKFELFNKRFSIYKEVLNLLDIVKTKGKPEMKDISRFQSSVTEADFLFGPEIREYLNGLGDHGGELWAGQEEYRYFNQQGMPDHDHGEVVARITTEKRWFLQQYSNNYELAREKFDKYLNVNKPSSFLTKCWIGKCFRC